MLESDPVPHEGCTRLHWTHPKMSNANYRQPSEFYRDEERPIIPPSASAEQPVRISINSYLRKIWRLATSTIVTRGSWENFANAAHSTTTRQCMSNSLEVGAAQYLFYQRHGNMDARCANVSMIGRDQHFHIIDFHPQINYLYETDNGRAVCAWISSYKELKPTGNPVECHHPSRW